MARVIKINFGRLYSKVDNFLKLYDDDVIKFDKSYTALEYFYKKYKCLKRSQIK